MKVDEAFIFGNYGTSVGLISKWNLNHLNDPREGNIVGIILAQCDSIQVICMGIFQEHFPLYEARHIPIINILLLYHFDLRKPASKTSLVEIFLNDIYKH